MRRHIFWLLILMLLGFVPGIGLAGSDVEGDDLIRKAPSGKALVYLFSHPFITHPSFWQSGNRNEVAVDGYSFGKFGERKYMVLALEPGIHTISERGYIASPWGDLESEFKAGEVYFVTTGGSPKEPEPVFAQRPAALKKLTKSKYQHTGNYEFDLDLRGRIASVRKVETFGPSQQQGVDSNVAQQVAPLASGFSGSLTEEKELIRKAPAGKALVYMFSSAFINVPQNSGNGGSSYEFAVDGLSLGQVGEREYLVFALTPGIHRVSQRAYTSWLWRNIEREFQAGQVYFVKSAGSQIEPEPVLFKREAALKKLTKSKYKHAGNYEFALDLRGQIASVRKVETFSPSQRQVTVPPAVKTTAISSAEVKKPLTPVQNRNAVAVVIGNRDYQSSSKGTPDVDFAINDVRAIRNYLISVLGFRDGNIITLENATQNDLMTTFGNSMSHKGQLYDWVRPGKSDVFVFYSGHGAPSLTNGQGYLLPVNADPQRVELSGYPLETLYRNLSQIPARSMTVVLDACFSGSSQNGTVVKNASSVALKMVKTTSSIPDATVLSAASVSEVASWDEERRHGLFTRYFLDGVGGEADGQEFGNQDGKVTLGELKDYLESEVTYQARRHYGREQHPQVSGNATRVMAVVGSN